MNIDKQIKEKLKLLTLLTFHEDCEVCNSYLLDVVSQIKKTILKAIWKEKRVMSHIEGTKRVETPYVTLEVIKDLLVNKI